VVKFAKLINKLIYYYFGRDAKFKGRKIKRFLWYALLKNMETKICTTGKMIHRCDSFIKPSVFKQAGAIWA
jgi:hypothetical protein